MSKGRTSVVAMLATMSVLGCGLVGAQPSHPPAAPLPAASPAPPTDAVKAAPSERSGMSATTGPDVRGFRAFCDEWMGKLRERERYNTAHIAWGKNDARVVGEYVGYSQDCSCFAREETGKDPIGKIIYRELRYRREGSTSAEALAAPGTILEQTEVTEIFRFAKGRWQY